MTDGLSQAIPVQKWGIELEDPILGPDAAVAGWHQFVRAQGWSPVGEPEVVDQAIVGRVVRFPGITVSPDIRGVILVPPVSSGVDQ